MKQHVLALKEGSWVFVRLFRSFSDRLSQHRSKVLRQKEKYLSHDDGSRSPAKRLKGRSPDIERALANWAKNQVSMNVAIKCSCSLLNRSKGEKGGTIIRRTHPSSGSRLFCNIEQSGKRVNPEFKLAREVQIQEQPDGRTI